MTETTEDLRPLYRTMLTLGVVAVLIFGLGLVIFLRFAAPGQQTGLHAEVEGVFPYDPAQGQVSGRSSTRFAPDQPFAAKVRWEALPSGIVVGASWYDSLNETVGGIAPESAARLAERDALIAVRGPPGNQQNLPGHYTLVVARYSGGRPVELLARKVVLVERGP